MPAYTYRCDACNHIFEVRHSMNRKLEDCPRCETVGALTKMPSQIHLQIMRKDAQSVKGTFKPGEVIKETIEEQTKELNEEKENLKKRMVDPKKYIKK